MGYKRKSWQGVKAYVFVCEKCKAKFNLDDSLLKNRGTKVQCSICKDIFIAYLQKPTLTSETTPAQTSEEGIQDTITEGSCLNRPLYAQRCF